MINVSSILLLKLILVRKKSTLKKVNKCYALLKENEKIKNDLRLQFKPYL